MKKFRIFLSLKKEEEWINSIQEEGYKLVSVNSAVPMYTFEKLSTKEMFIPVCGKINLHTIAAQKYITPQAA